MGGDHRRVGGHRRGDRVRAGRRGLQPGPRRKAAREARLGEGAAPRAPARRGRAARLARRARCEFVRFLHRGGEGRGSRRDPDQQRRARARRGQAGAGDRRGVDRDGRHQRHGAAAAHAGLPAGNDRAAFRHGGEPRLRRGARAVRRRHGLLRHQGRGARHLQGAAPRAARDQRARDHGGARRGGDRVQRRALQRRSRAGQLGLPRLHAAGRAGRGGGDPLRLHPPAARRARRGDDVPGRAGEHDRVSSVVEAPVLPADRPSISSPSPERAARIGWCHPVAARDGEGGEGRRGRAHTRHTPRPKSDQASGAPGTRGREHARPSPNPSPSRTNR